jgi:hypothetical protein
VSSPIPHDDIYIKQGATFEKSWQLFDADTGGLADPTGWFGRCEIRSDFGGQLITRFHSNGFWTGTIVLSTGQILLRMLSTDTKNLTPISHAVFDVELIDPSGAPWRIVQGFAYITPEVTTDA